MDTDKWFKEKLFRITSQNFEDTALEVFRWQAIHNLIFAEWIKYRSIDPKSVQRVEDIPFLPIEFFKNHRVTSGNWVEEKVFLSSGTTLTGRSKHYVKSESDYTMLSQRIFEDFMPFEALADTRILALLPSYLEQGDSSLICMVNHLIKNGAANSGYELSKKVELNQTEPTILFGVTYALLDLIQSQDFSNCSNLTVIETGGMKGRKKEITKSELHERLEKGFPNAKILSEYGMTELMSQAYGGNRLRFPIWARPLIRELNDPYKVSKVGSGGLNIIDLANIHSCAFIETKDLGSVDEHTHFEVLGRMDNSDIRGCSLLI